jgi:hypothetical protein
VGDVAAWVGTEDGIEEPEDVVRGRAGDAALLIETPAAAMSSLRTSQGEESGGKTTAR